MGFYSSVNFLYVYREPMSTTKFHYRDWSQYGPHRAEMRPSSPSRRDTPHPPGLSIQRAYNKYDEVFWIWNPNTQRLRNRYEMTLPHIEAVNFTCRHNAPSLHSKIMSSLSSMRGPWKVWTRLASQPFTPVFVPLTAGVLGGDPRIRHWSAFCPVAA